MNKFIFIFCLLPVFVKAQAIVSDEAIRYQDQRMVFQQWDQDKFEPKPGFLDLNPYYWLTWGLFDPNYHRTDLRPLSPTGPQTQRLGMVAAMNGTDNNYKLSADNIKQTALSQLVSQSGLTTAADPLWLLYYKGQLDPVINNTPASIFADLKSGVISKLVTEGTYGWYKNELDMLSQRIQAARTTNMDRGSRILAYYRFLQEYRRLNGVWSIRTSAAQSDLNMARQQQQLKSGNVTVPNWTPQSDIDIANKILTHIQ